jgi:hypothetical protein
MRRARLAESLLALVGDPERGASTVGDLMEVAGDRRTFWFWRNVVAMFLVQFGRACWVRPLQLLVLVWGGWGLSSLCALFFTVQGIILAQTLVNLFHFRSLAVFDWTAVVAIYATPWIVARRVALTAPGREFAAVLVVAVTFMAVAGFEHPALSWQLGPISRIFWVGGKALFPFALLIAGALVRRRSLRAAA